MRVCSIVGHRHLAASSLPAANCLTYLAGLQQRELGGFIRPDHDSLRRHGCSEPYTRGCLMSSSVQGPMQTHVQDPVQSPVQTAKPSPRMKTPRRLDPPYIVDRSQPWIPPHAWRNAVVLVDKPQDWTSFDVCGKLRRVTNTKKVGHAGTLDPMATGLLIVCTGRGTKAVESYMAQAKEYTGTLRLGQGTPSYDAKSEVNETLPWEHITDEALQAAREQFVGNIKQVPPMFSAIKVGGERLYHAARRGEDVHRPARPVHVSVLELTRDATQPCDVHFRVGCSKGTYIRSLVFDLGRALGSVAHLTALRRTGIGNSRVEDAWTVPELEYAVRASSAAGYPPREKQWTSAELHEALQAVDAAAK